MSYELNVNTAAIKKVVLLIAIGVGVSVTVLASFVQVDSSNVGILRTWGDIDLTRVYEPGPHWKCPIGCEIVQMNVQTQTFKYPNLGASTGDLQTVTTSISVILHPQRDMMNKILKEQGEGYVDKVISSQISNLVKQSTAEFSIDELVTNRETARQLMQDKLSSAASKYGIIVETVNIDDLVPPPTYVEAANQKKVSEQAALTAKNNVVVAKFDAEKIVTAATGDANANIAKAKGEAEAIAIINTALANNPNYLEWLKTQKWNGELPKVTGGAIPFVEIPMEESP